MAPPSGQGGHGMRGLWGLLLLTLTLTPLLATSQANDASVTCSYETFAVNSSDGFIAACGFARLQSDYPGTDFDVDAFSSHLRRYDFKAAQQYYLLFTFTVNNDVIEFTVEDNGMLTVVVQGVPLLLETVLLTHKWTRLCLAYNHLESEITVYLNGRELNVISFVSSADDDSYGNRDDDPESSRGTNDTHLISNICLRDVPLYGRSQPHLTMFSVAVYPDVLAVQACEEQLQSKTIYSSQSNTQSYCKDKFSVIFMNSSLTHGELIGQCQKVNGSLLSEEDLATYNDEINDMSLYCLTDGNILSWLHSGDNSDRFNSWCLVLLNDGTTKQRPCFFSLNCGLCKIRTGMSIRLYGDTIKYDSNYILMNNKDGSYFLKGQETSLIQQMGLSWVLQSNVHEMICYTANETTNPFVRLMWTCEDGQRNLTLSTCPLDGFACTSGMCIAEELRCDGVVHCDDSSDEENCRRIVKDPGYDAKVLPPPLEGETNVFLTYLFYVFSIGDITTTDGFADVDLAIGMVWKDSRLTVWDPTDHRPVDCSNIWAPKFLAADTWPTGHYVDIPDKFTSVCLIKMDDAKLIKKSNTDPYMSKYVSGSDVSFVYSMNGVFRIPCRYDLRMYPFGEQKCELNVWINAAEEDVVRFQANTDVHKGNNVPFLGRYDVGEYWVINTEKEEKNGNRSVSLIINIRSLYGYHLQNSYLTSFLILVISYSTFCFRTVDFGDRISVSLTAMLVMMVLFEQAQSTSIQTPYLKLLDIWYAAIISFSFLVVIAITGLNVVQNRLTSSLGSTEQDDFGNQQKMNTYNCATASVLCGLFMVFILFYMLAVVEII